MLPEAEFDVIFLAPAVTYDQFDATLANHQSRIAHFRSFGMTDDWEIADRLLPVVYPRSLLYFVSGLLEETIDEPLVGMERFLREEKIRKRSMPTRGSSMVSSNSPETKYSRERG